MLLLTELQQAALRNLYDHLLDQLKLGLVIARQSGEALYLNDMAESMLAQAGASDPKAALARSALFRESPSSMDAHFDAHTVFREQFECAQATVHATAMRIDREHLVFWLRSQHYFDEKDRTALRHKYELTPREVDLCVWLATGHNLGEFSAHHSITRETAKSHLRNTFRKTGCNSQVQLVVAIFNSLR